MGATRVTGVQVKDASIEIADLSATGTPSSATYLRGDNTWSTPTAGAASISQTEVDFGATPIAEQTFNVVDAGVSTLSQIIAQVSWEAPTGKDLDEIEMDDLQIRCKPNLGNFDMFIRSTDGSYLEGKFKINYLVG